MIPHVNGNTPSTASKIANTGSNKHNTSAEIGHFCNSSSMHDISNEKSNSNAGMGIRSSVSAINTCITVNNPISGHLKSTAESKMLSHSMYTSCSSGSEMHSSMDISTSINNSRGISATASHFYAIKQRSNDIHTSMLLASAQEIKEQERQNQNCPWACCYCNGIWCPHCRKNQHCDEYCVNLKIFYYLVLDSIFGSVFMAMNHF